MWSRGRGELSASVLLSETVAMEGVPAAQPEPSAQEPMEQRQGEGSIEQQLSELLGSSSSDKVRSKHKP